MPAISNRCRAGYETLRRALFAVLLFPLPSCVFVSGNFDVFSPRTKPLEERVVQGKGSAKIVLIDISRVISNQEEEGAFGLGRRESVVSRVEAELRRAVEDDQVRALILRVNTPGGTVTGSDIVYESLMRFKAEKKVPVLAQLMDVATSGGYYVALAADEIFAHPTTVTGSIGVVFQSISFQGLLTKIGIDNQTVKTGDKKDIGSPLRAMTQEERQLLEQILNEMQGRFLQLVSERRPQMSPAARAVVADGRILTAEQARTLGLVDGLGGLAETIERAKVRAGLTEARVVMYSRTDESAESIYARLAARPPTVNLLPFDLGALGRPPQFLYVWLPDGR